MAGGGVLQATCGGSHHADGFWNAGKIVRAHLIVRAQPSFREYGITKLGRIGRLLELGDPVGGSV
jgi:hypothetical protein